MKHALKKSMSLCLTASILSSPTIGAHADELRSAPNAQASTGAAIPNGVDLSGIKLGTDEARVLSQLQTQMVKAENPDQNADSLLNQLINDADYYRDIAALRFDLLSMHEALIRNDLAERFDKTAGAESRQLVGRAPTKRTVELSMETLYQYLVFLLGRGIITVSRDVMLLIYDKYTRFHTPEVSTSDDPKTSRWQKWKVRRYKEVTVPSRSRSVEPKTIWVERLGSTKNVLLAALIIEIIKSSYADTHMTLELSDDEIRTLIASTQSRIREIKAKHEGRAPSSEDTDEDAAAALAAAAKAVEPAPTPATQPADTTAAASEATTVATTEPEATAPDTDLDREMAEALKQLKDKQQQESSTATTAATDAQTEEQIKLLNKYSWFDLQMLRKDWLQLKKLQQEAAWANDFKDNHYVKPVTVILSVESVYQLLVASVGYVAAGTVLRAWDLPPLKSGVTLSKSQKAYRGFRKYYGRFVRKALFFGFLMEFGVQVYNNSEIVLTLTPQQLGDLADKLQTRIREIKAARQ